MQILNFIDAFWFWFKLTLLYSAKCMDSFVALNCVQTTSHWLVTRHWQWYYLRPATTSGNPVIELHLLHLHSICKLHNVNLVLCNLNDHSVSASENVCILFKKNQCVFLLTLLILMHRSNSLFYLWLLSRLVNDFFMWCVDCNVLWCSVCLSVTVISSATHFLATQMKDES